MVVEGRRRGSSLGFGRKPSLGINQRRHSEHRLKVEKKKKWTLVTMVIESSTVNPKKMVIVIFESGGDSFNYFRL